MSRMNVWWRRWWIWLLPALLLGANLAWLLVFRSAVVGRGSSLAAQVEQLRAEVAQLEGAARRQAEIRSQLAALRGSLDELRREQLAGMGERLIPFMKEVVHLGQEAGLQIESISYSYKLDDKTGLVYFSASYSVKGSYEQIRRCVYLLESSPQFIVLEGLALQSDQSAASLDVSVRLTMGTYFASVDAALVQELGIAEVADGSQN